MKYERITDEKFVKAVETCNMACVYGENCIECVYFKVDNCPESVQSKLKKAILRLAELEDKIEQGTLIEQKNGKWINLPDYGGGGWKMVGSDEAVQPKHCSICGDVYVKEYKYCPSCGAKMKD